MKSLKESKFSTLKSVKPTHADLAKVLKIKQADAARAKAEAERAKAEAERAKAEAERAKAEAERAKAEAITAEAKKVLFLVPFLEQADKFVLTLSRIGVIVGSFCEQTISEDVVVGTGLCGIIFAGIGSADPALVGRHGSIAKFLYRGTLTELVAATVWELGKACAKGGHLFFSKTAVSMRST